MKRIIYTFYWLLHRRPVPWGQTFYMPANWYQRRKVLRAARRRFRSRR